MPERYLFKLFIAGTTLRSRQAVRNLETFCNRVLEGHCDVEVVDVRANPEVAEDEHIQVTPTLMLLPPMPPRRYVGDLRDSGRILHDLGIKILHSGGIKGVSPKAARGADAVLSGPGSAAVSTSAESEEA